jgi:hypothetical protein
MERFFCALSGLRLMLYIDQALDGFASTSDNIQGLLPAFMREAGLSDVVEAHREATALGSLSFYQGTKR